ncbi:10 TM acyl transferase domain found in Cas1p-domain-containing protein [Fimicolochytrium jonesii]|uniref:10 TM acyl transferase domain found in Cas1p-domain-containing protein n=1 Tax=Fimicolochytrium jonesii TaxID=1396493 RepID=UPI0022FED99C|nr:10 TM acyl transferase domain found in Cas1p-domain-containing protein [Fimicolochytrium jonesii]KAI8819015.1 10 TM acyl transferase domain found in Cas1p-domain-containing protein [Fimicolochytrium jonesii]
MHTYHHLPPASEPDHIQMQDTAAAADDADDAAEYETKDDAETCLLELPRPVTASARRDSVAEEKRKAVAAAAAAADIGSGKSGDGKGSVAAKAWNLTIWTAVVIVLLAMVFEALRTESDPDTCDTQLADANWVTIPSASRTWHTETCFLQSYTAKPAQQCLHSSRITIIGDSTARQIYHSLSALLKSRSPLEIAQKGDRHSDLTEAAPGSIDLAFHWDPFLNVTDWRVPGLDARVGKIERGGKDSRNSLMLVSAGPWFMKYGGTTGFQDFSRAVETMLAGVGGWVEGIPDTMVVRPVNPVHPDKLDDARRSTMTPAKVHQYNKYLMTKLGDPATRHELHVPTYVEALYASVPEDHTADGFHYDWPTVANEVQLYLNRMCNARLYAANPAGKTTCCVKYAPIRTQQWISLAALFLIAALGWAFTTCDSPASKSLAKFRAAHLSSPRTSTDLLLLTSVLLYMLVTDRTSLLSKVNKIYSTPVFTLLTLLWLLPGLITATTEKDTSFMNRYQTDEWKGWMQLAILIYHYTGASQITPVYAFIRLLVASYLFMTGYGHFFFFYKKKVYTFTRAATTLLRLNVLSVAMAYVMDKDVLFYYFGPMVSFWFLVLWVTMWAGHTHNDNTRFIVGKIVFAAAVSSVVVHTEWVLATLFKALEMVFAVKWNATESLFRLRLDHLIVFSGMLTALVVANTSGKTVERFRPYAIAMAGLVLLAYTFIAFTSPSKFEYNALHPYISPLAVIAFTVLRNSTAGLRGTTSRLFRHVAKSSLELFLVQYHVWLAVDTRGVVVLPFGRVPLFGDFGGGGSSMSVLTLTLSSALSFIVFGIVFFAIAERLSDVSARLVDAIGGPKAGKLRTVGVLVALAAWNWLW